ncbi:folate-binding protein [Alcanivorax sp. JB21]|uniref:CAF17-like 4Fe-4S cluster assembly/insertion protein YgfZ n=1 Tax=Alcanivorax limicola TaxID=2874102 RepID=UPI001CBA6E90|nr:folate-binding protein [Alcanivorax limicola]MBZ2189825.1 folate-binding protein [Alcanivorax limicola]
MSAFSDAPAAQWTSFLNQAGARRDQHGIARDMGQAPVLPAGDGAAMTFAADHLRLVTLRGPDAMTFLQGQVCADVRDTGNGFSRLAMHLSLKGRGLVSMRVLPAEDGLDLLVPASMAAALRERLQKYIVFSKATLAEDPERVVLGIAGAGATEVLSGAGLPCSHHADGCTVNNGISLVRAGPTDRYLIIAPVEDAMDLWPALADERQSGAADHALLADIMAGEGHVLPGSEDLFLPQVLNYDLIEGVSFKKGCYTGQEVVARMKFKGQLKQRMRRLTWPGNTSPAPGTVLRNEAGKSVGEIVVSVACAADIHALAVLRHDHQGALLMDGAPLQQHELPLPYALPDTPSDAAPDDA